MATTGRKNKAGSWLQQEVIGRMAGVIGVVVYLLGLVVGFLIRSVREVGEVAPEITWWVALLGLIAAYLVAHWIVQLSVRRMESTWGRGLLAERRVGDLIEFAVADRGCAFAHDVKEALDGYGNVDHVVLTPAGVWVVETKASWLRQDRFHTARRQTAENVRRVRQHLRTTLPVRGALVIADESVRAYEKDHPWDGEPVTAFDSRSFWRRLRDERDQGGAVVDAAEVAKVQRAVWSLGSTGHLSN